MSKAMTLIAGIVLVALPAFAQEAGWIGISIEDQTERGALVRSVEPGSPAEKAGLKQGDIVLLFNKDEIAGVQQLSRLVRETPVGRTVDVRIKRDGRDQTVRVTTEKAPDEFGRFFSQLPDSNVLRDRITRSMPQVQVNTTFRQSGIRVQQLTDQLRDYFGVFSNSGVLVVSVDKNSVAERVGVKAGDVITAVDGRNIRTPADFSRETRTGVTLKIFRDKQERELKLE